MLLQFPHETGCMLAVDDDGRVAYAYLHAPDGDIIGDVWLYNRVATPPTPDWSTPPFLNAASHAKPLDQPPPHRPDDLTVEWTVDGELLLADIFLRGVLLARLSPGAQPGWNVLATQRGPCALPFDDDEAP